VVDEFDKKLSMEVITATCSAVGFNTVPSWMKPFHVLSNGEKFRVELARRLIEGGELVAVDEFTSVVDRQVAKIASHAVQKFVRKRKGQKFVAITCHYDVLDWLQPDWVYDPSTGQYAGRSLRRRPELDVVISQVSRSAWPIFAAYHYMSRNLHKGARCYGLWLEGKLTAFCGVLYRPTPGNVRNKFSRKIWGVSRVVTLPDYQGLGLAFVLIETLGAAYRGIGCHFHSYPAHPSFAHSHDRSANWQMRKRPGVFSTTPTKASSWMVGRKPESRIGGRPCAVFRYVGPAMPEAQARVLIGTGQADDIE
jgi:GNAT superfamily N-acetyltransferase